MGRKMLENADSMLTAHLWKGNPVLHLLQDCNDMVVGKSCLFYCAVTFIYG